VPYAFLDDLAPADVAFRAWGRDPAEVFRAAADATANVMVEVLGSVRERERRRVNLTQDTLDMLLFDLLQQLIYYKDAEGLLLRVTRLVLAERAHCHHLEADLAGETIDPARHQLGVDVKAVTLHRFELRATPEGWEAQVVLDV
jgi:SHS2 domain-containing protein